MKAVVWQGPGAIDLQEVPDPRIEQPSDAVGGGTTAWERGSAPTQAAQWTVESVAEAGSIAPVA